MLIKIKLSALRQTCQKTGSQSYRVHLIQRVEINKLNSYENRLMCSLIHKFRNKKEKISDLDYDKYIEELYKALPQNFSAKGKFYVFVDECHRT